MFGIIPKPLWEKSSPPDEKNRIDLALRLILIVDEKRKILIDTGIGDYHDQKFIDNFDIRGQVAPVDEALKEIGLTSTDITDVIFSHLHFDHAGGMLKIENGNSVSNFPNATFHIHKKHYEYGLMPNARDAGSFHSHHYASIIKEHEANNKVNWLSENAGIIMILSTGELRYVCSHGHTPYMIHPFNDNFIYLADLIPTSNHIKLPWVMGYDMNPAISTENKSKLLSLISERKLLAIYEHDPIFYGSFILADSKGRYEAVSKQSDPEKKCVPIDYSLLLKNLIG